MLGGTGGGKTWWGPVWLAKKILQHRDMGLGDGAQYIVAGATDRMVRDILVPTLEEHYKGTFLEGEYKSQANLYYLPTGGIIYFRSAEHPLRIEGIHAMAAWMDEPSQMKALVWPVMQSRVGLNEGPILFTGYPTNMGWYYQDIFKVWKGGDPDYDVIQFRSIDNPQYPKSEWNRAKRTLPDWLFKMRYMGQFQKPLGLVYPDFGESLFVEPFEIPKEWPVFVGIDPSTLFGALFIAFDGYTYYVYSDYFVDYLRTAKEHAKEISDRLKGTLVGHIYDPARIADVNELRQHGIWPLYRGANEVMAGVSKVGEIIKSGRLKVLRGSAPNFVDQMEKYSFPTDVVTGNIAKENPIKIDDHLPDCLRYILYTLEGAPGDLDDRIMVYDDPQAISKY